MTCGSSVQKTWLATPPEGEEITSVTEAGNEIDGVRVLSSGEVTITTKRVAVDGQLVTLVVVGLASCTFD